MKSVPLPFLWVFMGLMVLAGWVAAGYYVYISAGWPWRILLICVYSAAAIVLVGLARAGRREAPRPGEALQDDDLVSLLPSPFGAAEPVRHHRPPMRWKE